MILAGDIGGTKCLFGLYEGRRCLVQRRLASADFGSFDAALTAFLVAEGQPRIERACFAVAGPVTADGSGARLTNLPWVLDAALLGRQFGLPNVRLLNDFAAAALGAMQLDSDDYVVLQDGAAIAAAPRLVVGAGTGMGMAVALPDGGDDAWRIVAGEGGHVGFAPADATQLALWQFLHARFGRVIWEHVVSGPGLTNLHEFFGGAVLTPAQVSTAALQDPASPAGRALELFLAAYGAFAGDMALATLACGGVYLAGGIAMRLLPALQRADGPFLRAFRDKGVHARLMTPLPVYLITAPDVGLSGAACAARR